MVTASGSPSKETERRSSVPTQSSVVSTISEPGRRPTIPSVTSPIRSFGPGRSPRIPTSLPLRSAASRAMVTFSAWSARVPWEKLKRKTSAPASISSSMPSTLRVAGPIVVTILVRR